MRRFNLALTTLGLLGVAWMIAGIWWAYPDNHGAGPVWFQRFFIAIATASGVAAVGVRQLHWPTLGIAVLGLLATWIVDQRNIIVDYDDWIARGMPEWGQPVMVSIPQESPTMKKMTTQPIPAQR